MPQALAAAGLNVFAMYDEKAGEGDTGLGNGDFGWGSANFHKMGRQKVGGAGGVAVGGCSCGWLGVVGRARPTARTLHA